MRFFALIHAVIMGNPVSFPFLRPQIFRHAVDIVLNDGIGRRQNRLRGSIILLELDDFRPRIIFAEIQNVLHIRAAPRINALVSVADGANILRGPGNVFRHEILRVIRVLVLVDFNIPETPLPFFTNVFILQ